MPSRNMFYSKDANICFLKCKLESCNFSHQIMSVSHTYNQILSYQLYHQTGSNQNTNTGALQLMMRNKSHHSCCYLNVLSTFHDWTLSTRPNWTEFSLGCFCLLLGKIMFFSYFKLYSSTKKILIFFLQNLTIHLYQRQH